MKHHRLHLPILCSALLSLGISACGSDSSAPRNGAAGSSAAGASGGGAGNAAGNQGGNAGSEGGLAGYGGYAGQSAVEPSGYLLLSKKRLEQVRADVAKGAPRWKTLKKNVDDNLGSFDPYDSSPDNVALVYLLTGEKKYADDAFSWAESLMSSEDVTNDSYLYFGELMRHAALVLNWCADDLSASRKKKLIDYLEHWTDVLWTDNADGWGMNDPGNNYMMSFLEGTSFAGYALRKEGRPKGQVNIDRFLQHMDGEDGVIAYMSSRVQGGDWLEGANYGQASKRSLYSGLSASASMGGPVYFRQNSFFDDALRTIYYRLQPGWTAHDPWGDLTRDSAMPVTPLDREIVQAATFWSQQADARARGAWFMNNIVDDYTVPVFDWKRGYYLDVLYGEPTDVTPNAPDDLPLSIEMPGTHWINVRTSWKPDATSWTVSGPPIIEQSHQHNDVGSFIMWKRGWQAVDAITYSEQGCTWGSDAHNMVHVDGEEQRYEDVVGVTKFEDTKQYAYVQVDGTDQFTRQGSTGDPETLVSEYTRELFFLKPNTVVTYDRLQPNSATPSYDFRFHFASKPKEDHGRFFATNDGGGVSMRLVVGGSATVRQDTDIKCGGSEAWRVQAAPSGDPGRFLAITEVAIGNAPALEAKHVTSDGDLDGLLWNKQIVMFSSRPRGESPALPVHYTVPATGSLTHWIINVNAPVKVTTAVQDGNTVVTVSKGSDLSPSSAGVVRYAP